MNITGGTVDGGFDASSGSHVNISGGIVRSGSFAKSGSQVNISGGDVFEANADSGSVINISGGTVGRTTFSTLFIGLFAREGSVVNLSGGSEVHVFGFPGSEVNITGTQFRINGRLLEGLVAGESFTITEPIETLSCILADGSSFESTRTFLGSPLLSLATVTVTLAPAGLLGDFDGDEDIDLDDLDRYNQNIGAEAVGDLAALDLDGDGIVGANDFATHYEELVMTSNGQVGTVPGDANLDGEVNVLVDAFIFFGNLNGTPIINSWSQADFNGDGDVDVLFDAFSFVANLGFSNAP